MVKPVSSSGGVSSPRPPGLAGGACGLRQGAAGSLGQAGAAFLRPNCNITVCYKAGRQARARPPQQPGRGRRCLLLGVERRGQVQELLLAHSAPGVPPPAAAQLAAQLPQDQQHEEQRGHACRRRARELGGRGWSGGGAHLGHPPPSLPPCSAPTYESSKYGAGPRWRGLHGSSRHLQLVTPHRAPRPPPDATLTHIYRNKHTVMSRARRLGRPLF